MESEHKAKKRLKISGYKNAKKIGKFYLSLLIIFDLSVNIFKKLALILNFSLRSVSQPVLIPEHRRDQDRPEGSPNARSISHLPAGS